MRMGVIGLMLIITHILQGSIFGFIRISDTSPNFLVMIVVSFALLRGSKEGGCIGLAGGFLYDITFGTRLGPSAIIYGLLGLICGRLHVNFYRENSILPFGCTLLGSLFVNGLVMLGFMIDGETDVMFFITEIIIPELVYTIALTLIVYKLSYFINEKLEYREKRTRNIFVP
ncbi:MAG: rod shape-determining protein MreD [Epulopiscium sp. Nele67-Bin005]|nr:MAG: rod shape-determining protein MreD [Epulopiscium sp. Nele67-Bin005]